MSNHKIRNAADFYDALGEQYDEMTLHDRRLESLRPTLAGLAERLQIRRALDIGCGSGAHSIALAEAGVAVTAVDPSPAMVKLAESNSRRAGVALELRQATAPDLLPESAARFDTILCLGNTLPHILDESELRATLKALRELLTPSGHLMLQLLNYERILSERERIVGIRKSGARTYIRFYDFCDTHLQFNILIAEAGGKHRLISTRLHPWCWRELAELLGSAGFTEVQLASDLQEKVFDPATATDLVLSANR